MLWGLHAGQGGSGRGAPTAGCGREGPQQGWMRRERRPARWEAGRAGWEGLRGGQPVRSRWGGPREGQPGPRGQCLAPRGATPPRSPSRAPQQGASGGCFPAGRTWRASAPASPTRTPTRCRPRLVRCGRRAARGLVGPCPPRRRAPAPGAALSWGFRCPTALLVARSGTHTARLKEAEGRAVGPPLPPVRWAPPGGLRASAGGLPSRLPRGVCTGPAGGWRPASPRPRRGPGPG